MQAERSVVRDDAVVVPLGRGLAAIFRGKTSFPIRLSHVGHRRPMDREHIAVRRKRLGLLAGLLFEILRVALIEDLHLDPA